MSFWRSTIGAANGDAGLLFVYRRKLAKELVYDERSKPSARKRLKAFKRSQQGRLCAKCERPLPERYAVLDRHKAALGYTVANTQPIRENCDRRIQADRQYSQGSL
jgi:hypothetical protein